VTLTFNL